MITENLKAMRKEKGVTQDNICELLKLLTYSNARSITCSDGQAN